MAKLSIATRVNGNLTFQGLVGGGALIAQTYMLKHAHSTVGFSLVAYVSMLMFYFVNGYVSFQEFKTQRTFVDFKPVIPYIVSFAGQAYCIYICIISRIQNGEALWSNEDQVTFFSLIAAFILLVVFSKREKVSFKDARFDGYISGIFIFVPQVMYAFIMYKHGIEGVSAISVFLLILQPWLRITQIYTESQGHALSKKKKAVVFSEKLNASSWACVIVVYVCEWVFIFTKHYMSILIC